ncbi:MAG: c-type cytochrome, partial [Verrucomicrobia bacterium]|nr:c-type cytochrome [Verrucomicrobiota bacterium]
MDPVAFDWGADGKLWVVEMADHPRGIDDHGKPGGRIVFLEDTDGDGKYDKRTVFLDGVNFPNGIMCWRKGVLVSAAPEIFYAEDTDGDGKADVKKVLFTGFREGNQQHRINGFEYGLDNWVYAANGDSGGMIQRVGGVLTGPSTTNSPPIDIRGYDIRFKPDTGEIELVAGQTQFGRHRDDWGNWFGNNNPNWLWHYHIPVHYLKRNPQLVVKSTRTMLANYTPPNQVFTVGKPQQRFNWPDRINEVTSANSATPYRDDLFGPDFATSVFMSEPANNVVHREVLEPDGVTFKSHRAPDEQDREFLASADNWFRPTMLKTGPDGALYIADMYRLIIEHPEYFPEELKNRPDMRAGDDKGRIWRVVPEGKQLRKVPNLAKLNTAELVAAMDSPNGWQRDTVQRLIVQRGDSAAVWPLIKVLADFPLPFQVRKLVNELDGTVIPVNSGPPPKKSQKNPDPRVRLQALYALGGLGVFAFDRQDGADLVLTEAMRDPQPVVRAGALKVGEKRIAGSLTVFGEIIGPTGVRSMHVSGGIEDGEMSRAALRLVDDPDLRVRYQLGFTLGEWSHFQASLLLAKLCEKDFENPQMQVAIMSSAVPHVGRVLEELFPAGRTNQLNTEAVAQLIGLATAQGQEQSLVAPFEKIAKLNSNKAAPWQFAAFAAFLDALDRRGTPLSKFQASAGPELKQSLQKLDALFAEARSLTTPQSVVTNSQSAVPAIRLLGRGPTEQEQDFARLGALLSPQVPPEVQQAALASLKKLASPRVAELLLAKWNELMPTVRAEALAALMSRAEWTQALLAAIEGGKLTTSALGTTQQQQLLAHPSAAVRERAAKLFAVGNPDRQKVVKQYQSALELQGNPARGAQLFGGTCATCHKLRGAGSSVGPDLGTVADKPAASLLVAILDPNQAVDPAYVYYIGVTKDNRDVSGIIVTETPNSVTFRNAGGLEETVLRADLKELRTSGLSLMPEGLEAALNPQAIADIIAFIQSGAPAPARRK